MARDISITTIRYFIRIAELKNISKAAETLYVSQPTLSRQISCLEETLHATLITKTKTGISLTREGKAFFEKASQFMDTYDKFIEETLSLESLVTGTISIAYQKSAEDFLSNCNKHYLKVYPNVDLRCVRQGRKNIVSALLDGEYDVIYVNSLDVEGIKSVKSIRLFSQEEYLLMPRTNPLANNESVTFEDLKNERFIMTSFQTAHFKSALQIAACQRHNVTPNIVKYADNLDDFVMDILTYDAICFMPFMRGVENECIKYVRLKGHETEISTSIAWVHDRENIKRYIETVRRLIK